MAEKIIRDEKVVADIIQAASKLFKQYGLKKTTMDDVARAAGKGKSSLYYYYPGKNELFEAVISAELKKQLRDTRQVINAQTTAKDKLKAYLLNRLTLKEKMHSLSKVVYEDIFDHYKEICRIKGDYENTQVEFIREIILGGVQAGEFRDLNASQIDFFSYWTAAAFTGLNPGTDSCSRLTATSEACDQLIGFMLDGIGK